MAAHIHFVVILHLIYTNHVNIAEWISKVKQERLLEWKILISQVRTVDDSFGDSTITAATELCDNNTEPSDGDIFQVKTISVVVPDCKGLLHCFSYQLKNIST